MNTVVASILPLSDNKNSLLPINAVERETGISKELLRMWERRYDFPKPQRDEQGDRVYPAEQINKLRLIRRLLDAGFRPGKIINMEMPALEELLSSSAGNPSPSLPNNLATDLLTVLKSREPHKIRQYLNHQLIRMGLQSFILDLMQHANTIVGDAWISGKIEIHEEHLYTEEVQNLIRQCIGNLQPATASPRIMLTTAPEELHTLGTLMVEALLRLDNVDAVSFGAQLPIREIVQGVQKSKMDIVILSFSGAYPTNRAIDFLEELRFRLPMSVNIWAGGAGVNHSRRHIDGVQIIPDLQHIRQAVLQWRRLKGMRAA
ncbi:MerR family transcriptional regulator [Agitococcus lubricus]|uniref:B12 binding protein n=1 Tax=Agitococcus lubricus TaxID=1077255 RepID=A0A2T5IVH5_9GAMM|nr:MerR family transcriptional regulator [Agitococcus lubricus]PTQ87900.1 B12 binding protein [Agitococcus lubricus]